MKLLLDTNALLWTMTQRDRLSPFAIGAIEDEGNEVFVSVVSAWEIESKAAKEKLRAPTDLEAAIAAQRFDPLEVAMRHVYAVESLPRHHRDPFDRMLIVQAQVEGMTLVTADHAMRRYPVAVLPAS